VSYCRKNGFTLIELVVAMGITAIVSLGIYNWYLSQTRAYSVREQVSEMQQNARVGMANMVKEIRLAGHDPNGNSGAGIIVATSTILQVTMDLNRDGDTDDANEDVTYSLYDYGSDGDQDLGRTVHIGTANQVRHPIAGNIESLVFSYFIDSETTTTDISQIRMVQISLTSRTAKPDNQYPTNAGHRTFPLKSLVSLRNIGL